MNNLNWTPKEFHCYVLIYVSEIDLKIDEGEMVYLNSKFDSDTIAKIQSEIRNDNNYTRIDKISTYLMNEKHTTEYLNALFQDVEYMMASDGKVHIMENMSLRFLKRILGNGLV